MIDITFVGGVHKIVNCFPPVHDVEYISDIDCYFLNEEDDTVQFFCPGQNFYFDEDQWKVNDRYSFVSVKECVRIEITRF
jgi:hypothetical protein